MVPNTKEEYEKMMGLNQPEIATRAQKLAHSRRLCKKLGKRTTPLYKMRKAQIEVVTRKLINIEMKGGERI